MMIARLNKTYYLADSLDKKTFYSFVTKTYWRMVPRKLQKTENLCGFYVIDSAFLLFKFHQRHLKNIHDVNNIHDVPILNFISNFM